MLFAVYPTARGRLAAGFDNISLARNARMDDKLNTAAQPTGTGADSPTKRSKPKATKKANLAV